MADNANTTVGILSLMAKFDEGSVTEAARIANKSVEKAEKQISGFNLDKGLVENFEKAMKYVEKAIKKENVNLSKYTSNLITNLFNVEDAKDAEKALNNFIKPIETLEKLSKNLDLSLFNPKQLDEFIAKQEKINTLIKEEEQIKTNKEYEIQRRDEIKADNEKVRSIEKIIAAYKKTDSTEKEMLHNSLSKEQTNAIKTRIKAQQNLSKEQEEQIKNYSELITLYQIMSNNVPKKPTDEKSALELINYRKEMLKVATAIREAETEISSFSKKADFSTNLKFTVNNSEMGLDQAISFYFKNIKDYIKEERNKAEEELNKYIKDISAENKTARDKAETKNETYITGREKVIARKRSDNKGNFANNGFSGEKYTATKNSSDIVANNLEQEKQAYIEIDEAIEKYIVDLETAKKLALEASKSKQLQGANVTKNNVQDFKDLIGYTQRYIDLGGKLEDIGLDSTAMRIVNSKATLHFDSDIENFEEFRKAISKVVNAEKTFEEIHENFSGTNSNASNGFVQSKEEAEQLLLVLNGLNEAINLFNTKVNSIDGTTDNEFSKQLLEQKDEIKETFGAISNAITVELQEAFTDFSNNLNNLDERDWTFEKLRESLLNIVQQFQNSLQAVGLSSTQLDEAYKTIKGWNDADSSMAMRNNIIHGERGALLNSKSGLISNSFFSDAEHSFGDALFNSIKELSAGIDGEINTIYDTWVHSHPFRKAIDGIKTIGSDIGFSVADLDLGIEKLLKDKLPNMLVTNNYKYTNLDLTDVSEEITKQFLDEYKKELLNAGLTEELIDGKKKIAFPNKLAKHDGVYDFDLKTSILNDALKRAMSTVGLEHSRLTSGNIEDLKVDMTQLQTETNEAEDNAQELYIVLDKIANVLSEINNSGGFKFEGLDQVVSSLSVIAEKIQIIHDKSENTSAISLSEDKSSVLFGKDSIESQTKIKIKIEETTHDLQEQENTLQAINGLYRGIAKGLNDGYLNSYWTDQLDEAEYFANQMGENNAKILQSTLSFKNPFVIDVKGRDNNQIRYLGEGLDETSQKLIALDNQFDSTIKNIKSILSSLNLDSYFGEINSTGAYFGVNDSNGELKFYYTLDELIENVGINSDKTDKELKELVSNCNSYVQIAIELATNMDKIFMDSSNPYFEGTTDQIREAITLLEKYDGIIFKNIKDASESGLSNHYLPFSENQISNLVDLQQGGHANVNKINGSTTKNEISELIYLDSQIELITQKIKKLSDAIEQLPKIQIELDNQIDSEGNILDENLAKQINQIKLVFDNLNVGQITSVLETLKKFKISDNASSNLQKLANALLNFKSNLNNFSNESKEVLYLLESLVSQAENLKNFSKGLNNAFSEIKGNANSSNGNNKPKELTVEEKEEQRVKDIAKAYDDLSSNLQRYYALKNKELKGTLAKTNKLDERTELIELSSSVQNAVSGQGEYANATGKAAIAQAEFNKKLQEYAELSGENFKESIFSKLIKLSSAEGKTPEYYSQLEEIEEKIKTLLAFLPIDFTNTSEIQQLKEAQTEIEKLIKPLSGKQFNAVSIAQVEDLSTKISKLLSKNSAMPKALKEQLINLRQSLNGINNQVDLSKAIDEFKTLEAQIEKTGKTGISMGEKIKRKFKDLFAYAATYVSIQDGIQMAKQAYQYVAEIDKQIIELEKVTEASNSRVAQSFDNSTASAKELGSTISDVISATADWSRLGYNIDQSEKLAEVATIYKNVGDGIDMDSANESLISTLQGFQMEAEDAIEIVDKFNEVANNFPTSSSGIGIALQRSAASFNAANTDLSQSIALIVGSNSVLQDEEKVGVKYCQHA